MPDTVGIGLARRGGPEVRNRRFWASYRGMAILGLSGFGVGSAAATALLVFRRSIEPFMPFAFPLITGLLARHSHGGMGYRPEYYPWIVGWLYFMSALWLVLTAYSASRKPELDRRVDAYVRRNIQIDTSRVEPSPRDRARGAENERD